MDEEKLDWRALLDFIKKKKNFIIIILFLFILFLGSYIRTLNINIIKDVTTGEYIPTDLDANVFLRGAEYILENGKLFDIDKLRYYPLGYEPYSFHISYMIVYLYKFIHFFDKDATLAYVDVIYPVIAFAIGLIFFFLAIKKIFNSWVALLASAFLAFVPAYLDRTMVGCSDHDAMGMMFFFMAIYFYISALKSNPPKYYIPLTILSGVFTWLMGVTYGAVNFIYLIISGFVIIQLILGNLEKKDSYMYMCWFITQYFLLRTTSNFLSFGFFLYTFIGQAILITFIVVLIDFILFKMDIIRVKDKIKDKIPIGLTSLSIVLILGLLMIFSLIGFDYVSEIIGGIYVGLINPFGENRWQITVAEQHQPYISDWIGHMGWIYLLLFLIGSVYLFYELCKVLGKKSGILLSALYVMFLWAFTFSRYSPDSALNGISSISKLLYVGSLVFFIGIIFYLLIKTFYKNKEKFNLIRLMDKSYVFILIWFIVTIVGARGAIRLLFVFMPITAVLAGYLVYKCFYFIKDFSKYKVYKIIAGILLLIIIINPFNFAEGLLPRFYRESVTQARYSGPIYTQQWQYAGEWVRENLPEDAVFAHWWDYGYWVQTGFKRASITDGGNEYGYWNYLMGRNVLTGQNQTEALQFLKAHEANYLLIVNEDIGKYGAYASIGSDVDYDRYSWINRAMVDSAQTRETRNETIYFYSVNYLLDEDFLWKDQIFPAKQAGIGAVFLPVEETSDGIVKINQPTIAMVFNNKRTDIPLKCVYLNGRFLKFDGPNYGGCLRIIPEIKNNQQMNINAAYFISERVMRTLFANLFLLDQQNPDYNSSAFELVYDDNNRMPLAVYNGREIGPLKIWKINYGDFNISEEIKKMYLGFEHMNPDAEFI